MFERAEFGNRAILVHMDTSDEDRREDLSEFIELVTSAGAEILHTATSSRHIPEPKYFIGRGKADEIRQLVAGHGADLVLFNHALSPSQERNLEALLQCRVLDRTGLILDIFAQRARSFEGKLQVELAQLRHLSTRLVRGWTHLERQKGGIGLRGPGETQLETDRRLLGQRIKQINKRLEKVRRQREQGRQSRRKAEIPTVSLVGYTNAGKSTLFNVLTDESVYVQDQLFATLDPTLRKVKLENEVELILADTVGFIRHLPHDLVEAFRSTLQETAEAHLLLHVIDASDQNRESHIEEVEAVLGQQPHRHAALDPQDADQEVLRADRRVQHALGFVRGVGEDLLRLLGERQFGGGRDALDEDALALDLAAQLLGLDLEAAQQLAHRLLALAQDAEQDVLRLDHTTAQLARLVAGEEESSACLFVVLLEHTIPPFSSR